MQSANSGSREKEPSDALAGVFLFAIGIMLFGLLLSIISVAWSIVLLIGFTAGLSMASGLYLIFEAATKGSQ